MSAADAAPPAAPPSAARISPGGFADLGPFPWVVSRVAGAVTGTQPPAIFTTLGRTRGLFAGWLHFAGQLMPFGTLRRRESEMIILAVAQARSCAYEIAHHRMLGRRAGLTPTEIDALTGRGEADTFTVRERALLSAANTLVHARDLDDQQWDALRAVTSDREAIEVLLLVGHYDMLATALTTLRLSPDAPRR